MTIRIRLTYHGMDGEGVTVREAKADVSRKIERALTEMSKAPVIVSVDGRVALVAYDPGQMVNDYAGRRLVYPQGRLGTPELQHRFQWLYDSDGLSIVLHNSRRS
jgi:hypothetical protein